MDNHQLELASQLAEDGHLSYATCGYVISSFMIWSASFSAENRSLWLQLEVDRLINVVNFLLSQGTKKDIEFKCICWDQKAPSFEQQNF